MEWQCVINCIIIINETVMSFTNQDMTQQIHRTTSRLFSLANWITRLYFSSMALISSLILMFSSSIFDTSSISSPTTNVTIYLNVSPVSKLNLWVSLESGFLHLSFLCSCWRNFYSSMFFFFASVWQTVPNIYQCVKWLTVEILYW